MEDICVRLVGEIKMAAMNYYSLHPDQFLSAYLHAHDHEELLCTLQDGSSKPSIIVQL